MNESPKTKRGWRVARRILIAVAVIATLIAILYAEEDWRGKYDWENYKQQMEGKGETFDWQAFVPPTVPDDQNFFASPVFSTNGYVSVYGENADAAPGRGYWAYAEPVDLKAWQSYYRNPASGFPVVPQLQSPAADVLTVLSQYDSPLEQWREASRRPYFNVPMNYDSAFGGALSPLLTDFGALKRCCQVLELRALAELASGQSAEACDDVKLMLRLDNSLRHQPFIISHLVRMGTFQIILQPIWEGCLKHEWTDQELAEINSELDGLDFLADYQFFMRGERAFAIQSLENQRMTREYTVWDEKRGTNVTHRYLVFMPDGYFYQNELNFARINQQWTLPLVDTNSRVVSPDLVQRLVNADQAQLKHYSLYKVQALAAFRLISAVAVRVAVAQESADLTRIGCALERYRLAHEEYPETLDALVPQYMQAVPHDIINSEPLHYHRTSDGKFLLYSVGWNGTDDGGLIPSSKTGGMMKNCDWVWPTKTK